MKWKGKINFDGRPQYATDGLITGAEVDTISGSLQINIDGKSDIAHFHDDRYYTETEVDGLITTVSGKLDDHNEMNNLDYASSGHTGFASSDTLSMASATELTIVSGTVACTKTLHRIDTEGDSATDDLDTIIGGTDGDIIIVRAENGTRTVVLKDGTGNLKLGGRDLELIDTNMAVMLFYSGVLNQWLLIGDGGGSATASVSDDAFSFAWDGGTAVAPSRNAVYDIMVTKSDLSHLHDNRYYTESEVNTISGTLNTKINEKSDADHLHDDRYYTETELDNGQLDIRYYTESEVDGLITTISGKLDDHNEMNNLDYASAGHTGFQPAGDYATDSELTTLSGNLQTNIDGKDNYSSWSFAIDGSTKDAITSTDVLDFVGGDNITLTRSAEDQITISGSAGGGGGGLSWEVISTDTTAVTGHGYLVNASSGNITLTLPQIPSEGDTIGACDAYNQATSSGIVISRNGNKIEGEAEDLNIDIDGSGFTFVYADVTRGWEIVSEIGGSEIGGSGSSVSDTVYGSSWDGDTDIAPSKNSVYDEMEKRELKPIIHDIGIPGTQGFGLGICDILPANMSSMNGSDDIASNNYGNYQYSDGSIMCWIPKFYYRINHSSNSTYADYGVNSVDIKNLSEFADTAAANTAGYALHRAFIDGGTDQDGFFIDKYLCSNNSGTASSVLNGNPLSSKVGHNPFSGLTGAPANYYYGAIDAAKIRGNSFFCTTKFIYSALALLSLAHAQAASATTYCAWYDAAGNTNYPKGNNNNLVDIDDTGVTFTSDGYSSSASSKTGSGSPFNKTTHNGQNCGITDLNGNMWEIALGLVRSGTTDTEAINDSLGTTKFYVLKESVNVKDLTSGWTTGAGTSGSTAWGNAAYLEGSTTSYDLLDLPMIGQSVGWTYFGNGGNQVLDASLSGVGWLRTGLGIYLDAGSSAVGINLFGVDALYEYWRSNCCVIFGGTWSHGTNAGLWTGCLHLSRSNSSAALGLRCALYL